MPEPGLLWATKNGHQRRIGTRRDAARHSPGTGDALPKGKRATGFTVQSILRRIPIIIAPTLGRLARKALIVDLAEPHLRARSVGLYYLLRSLAITPAAFVGGLLWQVRPTLPFLAAGAVGFVGTMLFVVTVDEEHAG